MRPFRTALIVMTLATVALSGCIDPDAWEAESKSWTNHDDNDWEDDECAEKQREQRSSSGHHHHDDDAHETDHADPEDAFSDASPRYSNEVDGHEDATRTIRVPLGADELRVALVHDSDGHISFQLRDPLYRTWADEEADGQKYLLEERWAVVTDPTPGDWRLDIDIDGTSSYTVGFYVDD